MASSGPNNPGTVTNDTNIGTVAWSSTGNAVSSNDAWATAITGSGAISNYLKLTNFGFALPAGAVIVGITAAVEWKSSRTNGGKLSSIKLVIGSVISGNDKGNNQLNGTADTERTDTYGSSSDLWGLTPTQSQINNGGFGVVVSITENAGATTTHSIDVVQITVYYAETVTRDIATAGAISMTAVRSITSAAAISATATRSINTAGAVTTTNTRDVATAAAITTTATRSVTTGASIGIAVSRDVATAAALAGGGSRDVATAAAITATISRDVATAAATTAPASRDIVTAASIGIAVSRDIATAAALSMTGTRSIATAAATTAPAMRDVATAAAITVTVTRSISTAAAIAFAASRSVTTAAAVSRSGTRDILTAAAILRVESPAAAPAYNAPIIRLYDGSYAASPGGPIRIVPANTRGASRQYAIGAFMASSTITLALDTTPATGDLLVAGITTKDGTAPATVPTGWTLATSASDGDQQARIYYRNATSGDVGATYTWIASSFVTQITGYLWRIQNAATSSPLDATGTSTGGGSGVSYTRTATTGATTTEPQIVIVAAVAEGITGAITLQTTGDGTKIDQAGKPTSGPAAYNLFGSRLENSTGAKSVALKSVSSSGGSISHTGVTAVATFKANTSAIRFTPLGQFEITEGSATRRPYEIGEFDLKIPKADPLTASVREGDIVEWYIPKEPGRSGFTFEWYTIRHLEDHDDEPAPYLTISGPDLRGYLTGYVLADALITTLRGAPPANKAAENWARSYITNTAITPSASNDYATSDNVAGLALEASSGNRGTVYTDPPAKAGAPMVPAISELYKRDGLGWRIDLENYGTTTGALTVKTFAGTDRRFGIGTGEAVFASKWDTARRVTRMRDALNAVTALTLLGPARGSTRPAYYVEDANSRQVWGLIHGRIDGQNVTYPSSAVAAAMLANRTPRDWVEVDGRDSPALRLWTHYDLLDTVSAITRDGVRYDGAISAITIYTSGAHVFGSSGWASPELFGLPDPEIAATAPAVPNPPPFTLVIGSVPATLEARSKEAAALAPYTYLEGLTSGAADLDSAVGKVAPFTGTGSDLNRVAGVTPGTRTGNKAVVVDGSGVIDAFTATALRAGAATGNIEDAATKNTPKAATGAAALKDSTLGAQAANDLATTGGVVGTAADAATVNTAFSAIVAKLNSLIAQYNAALDALKATGGARVIND